MKPVIHLNRDTSGGGGSGTGWSGQVEFRADLPITIGNPAISTIYLVEKPTKILLGAYTTYQSGLYIRDFNTGALSDWRKLNVKVKFTDTEFAIVNAADESKQAKFDLSLVTTSTTRTYNYPDKNGTIALLSDIPTSFGNYAQTVQSATINTVGEQSIVGSGVGSLSIPANAFQVGDSFHGKIGGLINATGGGGRSEITLKVKNGATILATTGIFDLDAATNQGWECELDFTIATIGATGSICTNGNFAYTKDNNRAVFGYIFQDVKVIDTTVSNTLDITVEWNVLNGGDDIYSANFVLYKVF